MRKYHEKYLSCYDRSTKYYKEISLNSYLENAIAQTSYKSERTVLIGEIGLGGQVCLVSQMDLRLKEAAKLGFKRRLFDDG